MRKSKSKITSQRISEIKNHLHMHHRNIARLHAFSKNDVTFKYRGSKRTPEDNARMQWTIKNLTTQTMLLKLELKTLIKYGA